MKILVIAVLLAVGSLALRADDPAELKSVESRYDTTKFATDEASRAKYILELARLRFKLLEGPWQKVDAEIKRHPVPANSDSAALSRLRLGVWHSSRHDYRFKPDGTWRMIDDDDDPDATEGGWSIKGNRYAEDAITDVGPLTGATPPYIIILLDKENFIYTDGPNLYFEKRTLGKGLPIRRDERGE
jgi:hypothetical protein